MKKFSIEMPAESLEQGIEEANSAETVGSVPRSVWILAAILPLIAGIPWAWGFYKILPGEMGTFCGLILLAVTLSAAIDDYFRGKISNWATYPAFVWLLSVNLVYSLLSGNAGFPFPSEWIGAIGFGNAMIGAAGCFVLILVPYILGMGGAGDAKLAAVIGAGLGLVDGLVVLAVAFIVAAMLMVLTMMIEKGPKLVFGSLLRRIGSWIFVWIVPPNQEQQHFLGTPLVMGPSFLFGLLVVLSGMVRTLLAGS